MMRSSRKRRSETWLWIHNKKISINLNQRSGLEFSEFQKVLQGTLEEISRGAGYPDSHGSAFNLKVMGELKEKLLWLKVKWLRDRRNVV